MRDVKYPETPPSSHEQKARRREPGSKDEDAGGTGAILFVAENPRLDTRSVQTRP